ncbi:MAG TPA: hypothetical protein GXX19_05145 [Syntrophomonadaceae bacterium]|nr:hypothetical protein [Syntrophomonadaceae bacterium]
MVYRSGRPAGRLFCLEGASPADGIENRSLAKFMPGVPTGVCQGLKVPAWCPQRKVKQVLCKAYGGGLFDVLVTHLAPVRSMIELELIWGAWLYYYYRFKAEV